MDRDLALLVAERDAQATIDACREAGVYDRDRHVADVEGGVAVPVTAVPEAVEYREVVHQVGEPKRRTLADRLRERGFSEEEVDAAPGSWAVVGSVLLADFEGCERASEVGEALLDLHGEADTVLDRGPISGPHREPEVRVVAGSGDTETVHREHGTAYALDLAEVMFSPGNKAERARMGDVVADGERALDMFAGVGYFALPMARGGADVTAVERNPAAFRYLIENAELNDVGDRLHPYRGDCREVVPDLAGEFDRVVMGHYDAVEYLDEGLAAVGAGGTVHVHDVVPADVGVAETRERVEAAADRAGRTVDPVADRLVKTYSEGLDHAVLDVRVA